MYTHPHAGGRRGKTMITALGRQTLYMIRECGAFVDFVLRAVSAVPGVRGLGAKTIRAVYEMGVRSLPIVLIVGLFTGMVLGLQGYYTLSRFGSESLLGAAVAVSLVRELGPVLTALMVTAQFGSAMAAELGIQRDSEQIDALETMGVNPYGFLVAPRLLAAVLVFPLLTAAFDLIGMFGGHVSAVSLLALESGVYWNSIYQGMVPADVYGGFLKAVIFGLMVISICAYEGYNTHRKADLPGARGISQSTTRAVVLSCIGVVGSDYIITSFLV